MFRPIKAIFSLCIKYISKLSYYVSYSSENPVDLIIRIILNKVQNFDEVTLQNIVLNN